MIHTHEYDRSEYKRFTELMFKLYEIDFDRMADSGW